MCMYICICMYTYMHTHTHTHTHAHTEDLEWLDRQDKGLETRDEQLRVCVQYRVALKRLLVTAMDVLDGYIAASLRVGAICTILVPPSLSRLLVTDHGPRGLGVRGRREDSSEVGPLETSSLAGGAEEAAELLRQAMEAMQGSGEVRSAPAVDKREVLDETEDKREVLGETEDKREVLGETEETVRRDGQLETEKKKPLREDDSVVAETASRGDGSRGTGNTFINLVESVLDASVAAPNDLSSPGSSSRDFHSSAAPEPPASDTSGRQKHEDTPQLQGNGDDIVGGTVKRSHKAERVPEGGYAARLEARSLLRSLRGQGQHGEDRTGSAGGRVSGGGVTRETMEMKAAAESMRQLAASLGGDSVVTAGEGQQMGRGSEDREGGMDNCGEDDNNREGEEEAVAVEGLMDAIALFGEPREDSSREETSVGKDVWSKSKTQVGKSNTQVATNAATGKEGTRLDRDVSREEAGNADNVDTRGMDGEGMAQETGDRTRERGRGKGMRWDGESEEFEFFF